MAFMNLKSDTRATKFIPPTKLVVRDNTFQSVKLAPIDIRSGMKKKQIKSAIIGTTNIIPQNDSPFTHLSCFKLFPPLTFTYITQNAG